MRSSGIYKGKRTSLKSLPKHESKYVVPFNDGMLFNPPPKQNVIFLSNLTKFRIVPSHLILHMFKVCLDDLSGTNVENIALLLEGCGRFLLRSEDTRERFGTMVRV